MIVIVTAIVTATVVSEGIVATRRLAVIANRTRNRNGHSNGFSHSMGTSSHRSRKPKRTNNRNRNNARDWQWKMHA